MKVQYGLLALTVGATVFMSGCDFFKSKNEKVEIMKLEQKKAEQDAIQKKDAAAALKTYIEGKCQLIIADAKTVANDIAKLDADAARLEKAVASEMDGVDVTNESTTAVTSLANVLRNPVVNELAQSYLAAGFSAQCGLFVDRAKAAMEAERAYRSAIKEVQATYAKNSESGTKWQKSTSSERSSEIYRLKQEIVSLEKRLRSERKKLQGNKTQENERRANIDDYESQLRTKRRQLDYLLNPANSSRGEEEAARSQMSMRERARSDWSMRLLEIERRFKPKVTAGDIVRETEAQTIGALRKEIQTRKAALAKKQAGLEAQVRTAKEALLEVPVCDESELRQLRLKMDRALAAERK